MPLAHLGLSANATSKRDLLCEKRTVMVMVMVKMMGIQA